MVIIMIKMIKKLTTMPITVNSKIITTRRITVEIDVLQ